MDWYADGARHVVELEGFVDVSAVAGHEEVDGLLAGVGHQVHAADGQADGVAVDVALEEDAPALHVDAVLERGLEVGLEVFAGGHGFLGESVACISEPSQSARPGPATEWR